MNIWTVKEGEPLPLEGCSGRIMRCGIVSFMLAERGNKVTWWSSTYFHQQKKYIAAKDSAVAVSDNLTLRLLHSKTVYRKNVSFKRFRYSNILGKQFAAEAGKLDKPDVIFCAYPLIDFAYEAVKYGIENNVPVVVDIRDMWPDIFTQPFPKALRPCIRLILSGYKKKAEYCLKNATMVTGVTPYCLKWAHDQGRKSKAIDRVVYLAYKNRDYSDDELIEANKFTRKFGLSENGFNVCYFGNITNRIVDFDSVLYAASKTPNIKYIICGDGIYLEQLKKKACRISNVILTGYIN